MSMQTPRDLFEHELLDMYDAEHRLATSLPKMAKSAADETLSKGFEQHAEQTQGHIERIEECCKSLGIKPERETCPGMAGLVKEYDQFVKEEPSDEVMTLFLMSAAEKTEHYEIVGYRSLIDMATQLGEKDVARILGQTLKEEEKMAEELEKLQGKLGKKLMQAA